jgi:hypothetical protein
MKWMTILMTSSNGRQKRAATGEDVPPQRKSSSGPSATVTAVIAEK